MGHSQGSCSMPLSSDPCCWPLWYLHFLLIGRTPPPPGTTPLMLLVDLFLSPSGSTPFGPSRRIVPEIDTKLVTGRFKLRHHDHDGLDRVLEAYDVPKEDIEAIRDATIITTIEIDADGEFSITTSDAGNPEQANTVRFTDGEENSITNPLNGETLKVVAEILSPTTIQIRSEGSDSGTVEIKTWSFLPEGAMVTTEVLRGNQLFPVTSSQVMVRVDEDNRDRPLTLGWI